MNVSDIGALLGSVSAMAAWAGVFTAWIRKHWLTKLDGVGVTAFAVLTALITTALLAFAAHLVAWTPLGVLAFGIVSGVFASGANEVGKGFLSKPLVKAIEGVALPLVEKYLPAGVKAPTGDPAAQAASSGEAPVPPAT